jgi:ketol-acid reductoisomerase
MADEDAFRHSVDSVRGPISRIISRDGVDGVYYRLNVMERLVFVEATRRRARSASN